MKLIRCYIENFGGLSQYRLEFQEGLTTVQAENGFGKTTLAEFIRTMFYGFPRAGKTLDKNPRKKYAPWNGGVCGGYLIFEHGGQRYRISRRFGATPKGDSFELTDERTHRKSADFTQNIGLELFGLDAESFERSTYLPQLYERTTIATTGIQSKLGDLVHDTNDINNFDQAIRQLREKRSACIPYKGRGGSVAEARSRAAALHEQIDRTEALRPALKELLEQIRTYTEERDAKTGARESVRKELLERSRYDAKRSAEKQRSALEARMARLEAERQALLSRYPGGLPGPEELPAVEAVLRRLEALAPLAPTRTELQARETAQHLAPRFPDGVPDANFFGELRGVHMALTESELELRRTALSDREQSQLCQLEDFFSPGVPEEEALDRSRQQLREYTTLTDRLNAPAQEEPDQLPLEQLKRFFAGGVPQEEELTQQQSRLDRIAALRQENQRIAAMAEEQTRTSPADRKPLLAMLLGGVLLCIGTMLLMLELSAPGIAGLVLGGVLLAAGFAGKLRQDVAHQLRAAGAVDESDRQRLRDNTRTIDQLEQQVRGFTARYRTDALPLQEQLSAIRTARERYLELSRRSHDLDQEADRLRDRAQTLAEALSAFLTPYFGSGGEPAAQLPELELRRRAYRELQEKQTGCLRQAQQLERQCAELRRKLADALAPYFPGAAAEDPGRLIQQLEQEGRDYAAAADLLAELERQQTARSRERKSLRNTLEAFTAKYALDADLTDPDQLDLLREEVRSLPRLNRQLRETAQELTAFRRDHRELLALPARESLRDPEGLRLAEARLTARLQELEQELAALEQRSCGLRAQLDTIPQLGDEAAQLEESARADTERAGLLDQTIRLLEQARESLSNRYMGTVQARFLRYMDRISGEDPEQIQVTAELEVRVERLGELRPLEAFSAGQTDLILLCMRLALADALFQDSRPFLILDDPFVNLDDRHLKRALEVLQELSRDHQIVYLVCSSSRVPQ